jgi:outer membrane lipoprotein-sorting protein
MKKIIFLVAALLMYNVIFAQADTVACTRYHTGFFSYTDTSGNMVIVQRKKNYQYEKNTVTKVKTQDKIKWLNSCTYEITIVSTNSRAVKKYKYSTTKVSITKVDGNNGYAYSCACNNQEKNKGYMKQLSKKEFFDLY